MKHSTISVATTDDIPGLLQLINSAYRGEDAKRGWTHEAEIIEGSLRTDEDELLRLLNNPNAVILKHTEEKRINGCVYLEKKEQKLYLGMLSVSPFEQSKGIGKKLLSAADNYARDKHLKKIEMTVISRRHELIAWYERNGYAQTEERLPFEVEKKFGIPREEIDFMVMEKTI